MSGRATPPRRSRPSIGKAYGLARRTRGLLSWTWARRRILGAHNYWVATTRPDGRPHAMPVWGVWLDEAFVFSTERRSRKARNLARRPQIVVHLESGAEVVILEGRVREVTDPARLERYVRDYHAKYRFRPDDFDVRPVTYEVRPRTAFAWRERDFPTSATRWRF